VSHHVLNNNCFKQLIRNDFRTIDYFCSLSLVINLIIYLKLFSSDMPEKINFEIPTQCHF